MGDQVNFKLISIDYINLHLKMCTFVIVSKILRSGESSLERSRRGAQRPGFSPTRGLCESVDEPLGVERYSPTIDHLCIFTFSISGCRPWASLWVQPDH